MNPKEKSLRKILEKHYGKPDGGEGFIHFCINDRVIPEIEAHYKTRRLSRTEMSRIIGQHSYVENGKIILHDNGFDKIIHAIFKAQKEKLNK